MENLEFLLKDSEMEKIRNILCRDSFIDTYNEYAKTFLDKSSLGKTELILKPMKPIDKGIFLIENSDRTFYDGELWMFEDIDYIGKLDYLFTVPQWDWWINPLFSRERHRGEDKSVLIINKFDRNKKDVKKRIASEGFVITESYDLKQPTPELTLFYKYLDSLLPMNFARELKRIDEFIRELDTNKINFVLRGGYFLKEFFNYFKEELNLLSPREKGYQPNPNEIYVDDCIGSMRTFSSLGFSGNETFNFCCLNSTLPKRIYQKYFPNINFSLPSDLLNIYSCRLFEENPKITGLDYSEKGLHFYNNPVRDKIIAKIRDFLKIRNLENKTYKLAKELINYDKE